MHGSGQLQDNADHPVGNKKAAGDFCTDPCTIDDICSDPDKSGRQILGGPATFVRIQANIGNCAWIRAKVAGGFYIPYGVVRVLLELSGSEHFHSPSLNLL